jgi:O-acetyl-ADP-ribose deacetylase (regulator of RNase III)
MSIKIKTQLGNLMHVKSGHIVHGCNAQGVMGSGVALGIRHTFPAAYIHYLNMHSGSGLVLGRAYRVEISPKLSVWNAITQNLYGTSIRQVSYDAIETCFREINEGIYMHRETADKVDFPTDVHIPMIGAARGGGNWEIIREIIEQTMEYPVTLWLPDSTVTTL